MHLITILGATSSGKTQLSLDLCGIINSEGNEAVIVNCDSRQIYKLLDLGTGKIAGTWDTYNKQYKVFYYEGKPHFLIDYVDPRIRYSMTDFLLDWCKLFKNELKDFKGTVILVGGTGLWAKAINENYQPGIVQVQYQKAYDELKSNLQNQGKSYLQDVVTIQLNAQGELNQSDWNNPRRLLNFILRKTAERNKWTTQLTYPTFESKHIFAVTTNQNELNHKIIQRIDQRIEQGMIQEVNNLGFLGNRLIELGLEYKWIHLFLTGMLSYQQAYDTLVTESINYSKRQKTWLKKQQLTWIEPDQDNLLLP